MAPHAFKNAAFQTRTGDVYETANFSYRSRMALTNMPVSPVFKTLEEMGNDLTECALHLVAAGPVGSTNPHVDPLGTASLIAPHLAVTAKHVAQDYFRTYQTKVSNGIVANFSLEAIMYLDKGTTAVSVPVTSLTMCQFSDIALLRLGGLPNPPPFSKWIHPRLDLRMPPIGSPILGMGYHSAFVASHERHMISRELSLTTGHVIDWHQSGRDSRLNFPCFQTDARFDGGMSGGPVFNEVGALCGVISSNLPPYELGEPHISYVATLAPIAAEFINYGLTGADSTERTLVLNLIHAGVINAAGWEGITVTIDESADRIDLEIPRLKEGV